MTFEQMISAMQACEQTSGLNVLQHGQAVWAKIQAILNHDESIRYPDWWSQLEPKLHDLSVVQEYAVYHDCGKPFCRTVDGDGRVHFPNHAEVSKKTFLDVFPEKAVVANLIGWDMDFHILGAEELEQRFKVWSRMDADTLLLTAFAEVHANAEMFGGIESSSFKIKYKNLDRRGKQLLRSRW